MKRTVISLEEAIGLPISHDLTLIDAETGYKGARFKRGHVVTAEDMPLLRSMGRAHLNVLELDPDDVHEDTVAKRLAAKFAGECFDLTEPAEGRINLKVKYDGILEFNEDAIHAINSDTDWVFATVANWSRVMAGETVAAWRIGPLVTTESRAAAAEREAEKAKFTLHRYSPLKTALVTTGREIAEGRTRDNFLEKLPRKIKQFDAEFLGQSVVTDDVELIASSIADWRCKGAQVVVCTGGMSVDADDVTPEAIRRVCDEIVFRGLPTLPGSNLMLGRCGEMFVLGVPACAVHAQITILDTMLSRVYAGIPPTYEEVRRWGVGGLCRCCERCNYPVCPFGGK